MKSIGNAVLAVLLGLVLTISGCTESRADRHGKDSTGQGHDDGGIDIQAPGVDLKINTEGVRIDVDTDGDGDTRSN